MQNIVGNKILDFPFRQNAVGNGGGIASRLIPALVGSQYGLIDTPVSFGANEDFEIPIKFASTDTGVTSGRGVFGYSVSGVTNFFQINTPTDVVSFQTPDGAVSWAAHGDEHLDGKVHEITPYREGLTIGIKLDGVIKASTVKLTASQIDIDLIGCLGVATVPSQFFEGDLLSVKFNNLTTGEIAPYVFDSGSNLYQLPRGEGLGSESVAGGELDKTSDFDFWTAANVTETLDVSRMKLTATATPVVQTIQTIPTVAGKTYFYSVTAEADAGNSVAQSAGVLISNSSPAVNKSVNVNGTELVITGVFEATGATSNIALRVASTAVWGAIGDIAYFKNVTVRQLPDNTCLLTNFSITDWFRYTQQKNILHDTGTIAEAWIGDNRVPDEIIASGLTVISGTTITWSPSTGYNYVRFTLGNIYLVSGEVTSIPAGALHWNTGSLFPALTGSLGGFISLVPVGVTAADLFVTSNGSGEPDITADNMSVRKLLEVA